MNNLKKIITNYYINKIISFFKNQIVFDVLIGSALYSILLKLIYPVIHNDKGYIFDIGKDAILKSGIINMGPHTLSNLKRYYYVVSFLALVFIANDIYERFLRTKFEKDKEVKWNDVLIPQYPYDKTKFQYILGLKHEEEDLSLVSHPKWLAIAEEGLFQNVLGIGTIGQGKTIAEVVQFLVQSIYYQFDENDKKAAMLCLDVKGNFYKFVHAFAKEANRWDDVITIEVDGKWKYNAVHKPNLSPIELAHRMRYVLELFAGKSTESFWIDKAEDTLVEIIKIIRMYNKKYVDFEEIHFNAFDDEYRNRKITEIQMMLDNNKLNEEDKYDFITARNYFRNEFDKLDGKAQGFIKSEITRITQPFISTKKIKDTFCPKIDEINFYGFEDIIKSGKIVVWKINANKEPKIAKLVAAYLKLDFQKEILTTLDNPESVSGKRVKEIVCDEYHEYVTKNDAEFLSQSREAKACTFATTQSYTSIKNTLKDEVLTDMLLQNFVNKLWLRTDDEYTVKKIMLQTGKEDKEKVSQTITENSRARASYALGKILGKGKNLSAGISIQNVKEHRFDEFFLMQKLDAYKCVAFLSTGKQILRPTVVHMIPMFEGRIYCENNNIEFINDEERIFKYIGKIDVEKLENETVKPLKETELLPTTQELSDVVIKEKTLTFIMEEDNKKIEKDLECSDENLEELLKNIDQDVERGSDEVLPEKNLFDSIGI